MAMLCLGRFVFALPTAPYQTLRHQLAWRHPTNGRLGLRPARQYLGPDDETITLQGVLLPEITGGEPSLKRLRAMADTGRAWVLIDGSGELYGLWVIENLEQTKSVFFQDGKARRIEFSITLARADDDAVDQLGDLTLGDDATL